MVKRKRHWLYWPSLTLRKFTSLNLETDEYAERMEDVLGVYKQPYDPIRPVVCLNGTSRQLIGEITAECPAEAEKTAIYDYKYMRNGVVDIFMMFEPLAGRRYQGMMDTRTRMDFAHFLYDLSEKYILTQKK